MSTFVLVVFVLDSVVGEKQSAFIKGCHIFDNFIIAHQILHSLKHKKAGKMVLWFSCWI